MTDIIINVSGILGILTNVVGIQIDDKKKIMISIILANILFAINFGLLGGLSGSIVCLISAVMAVINYTYDMKGKKYPKLLIWGYYIAFLIAGVITYNKIVDILPIISAWLLVTVVIQSRERNIRILSLLTFFVWIIYDICIGSIAGLISDSLVGISCTIAIFRYDILRKNKNE